MKDAQYKKIIRDTFDEASEGYDSPAMRFFDLSAEHLVGSLSLNGDERLLDIATGTGKIALAMAKRLGRGSVTGLDISEGMLEHARRKAREEDLKNISFRSVDIDRFESAENDFDGLTCGFGVHFWSDMERSLGRLVRFVKPGGFVAITSFADGSFDPQSRLTLKRFGDYGVKLPKSYSWERLDSIRKNRELFGKLGLRGIKSYQEQMGYYLKDAEEWWDLVRFTGFRAFLDQLSEEQIKDYKEEHLREIRSVSGQEGIRLNVEVIFTIARK